MRNQLLKWQALVILMVLISLMFVQCKHQADSQNTTEVEFKDTISLDVKNAGKMDPSNIRSFLINDTLWLAVLNAREAAISLFQYSSESGKITSRENIPIPKASLSRYGYSSFEIVSKDSIFLLPVTRPKNPLYLINDSNVVLNKWNFNDTLPNGNGNYNLHANNLAFYRGNLIGRIYRDWRKSEKLRKKSSINDKDIWGYLYDYPTHFKVNFQEGDSAFLTNSFAEWPSYVNSGKSFYKEKPRFVIKEKTDTIAILYEKKPLLQFYDLTNGRKLGKKQISIPSYEPGLPYQADLNHRNARIKSSLITSFEKDFDQRHFYAIYLHEIENLKGDGSVKVSGDKEKTVIVFNRSFAVKETLKIKNHKKFYGHIIRGREGFFLLNRDHNEKIKLYFSSL